MCLKENVKEGMADASHHKPNITTSCLIPRKRNYAALCFRHTKSYPTLGEVKSSASSQLDLW